MKFFRKSLKKMSELQSIILRHEGKNLSLLLDMKIRWNSILPMIKRYLRIKNHIREIFEEYDQIEKYSTISDEALKDIVETLEPLEEAIIILSKCDTNIIVAEGAMSYVFEKLKENNTSLSRKIYSRLHHRCSERDKKTSFPYF